MRLKRRAGHWSPPPGLPPWRCMLQDGHVRAIRVVVCMFAFSLVSFCPTPFYFVSFFFSPVVRVVCFCFCPYAESNYVLCLLIRVQRPPASRDPQLRLQKESNFLSILSYLISDFQSLWNAWLVSVSAGPRLSFVSHAVFSTRVGTLNSVAVS
jgi:hypothetical protein